MRRFIHWPIVVGAIALIAGMVPQAGAQSTPDLGPQPYGGTTEMRHVPPATQQGGFQAAPEDLSRVPMRAGDVLSVQVFNAPDLSGLYTVDSGNSLTLPLIGKLEVENLTLTQTESKIADALQSKGYILNPSVTITVQQYAPAYVSVLGEVQSPGRYQLLASHSLNDVLGMAGGPTLLASGRVEIKRTKAGETKILAKQVKRGQFAVSTAAPGTEDDEVLPGDQVLVERAGVVYVLGGVYRPGGYIMQEDGHLNVVQAIALASGTTLQAAVGSTKVVRRMADGSILQFAIDYKRMVSGDVPMFMLHPQDVVYVPLSKTKTILTGGATEILSAATAAIIYTHP